MAQLALRADQTACGVGPCRSRLARPDRLFSTHKLAPNPSARAQRARTAPTNRRSSRLTLRRNHRPNGWRQYCTRRRAQAGVNPTLGASWNVTAVTQCERCDRGQHRVCRRLPHCKAGPRSPRGVNKREKGAPDTPAARAPAHSSHRVDPRRPLSCCARIPNIVRPLSSCWQSAPRSATS